MANLFSTGNMNVGIDGLTMGVSTQGMQQYREDLRMELLEQTKEKLEDVGEIQTAVDAGWQGEARDKFLIDFGEAIRSIEEDLVKEYNDLDNRLQELEQNYFTQDKNMMN